MSFVHYIKDLARSQYFRQNLMRAVEGIVVTFMIIVGIAAVCYIASAIFRALGVQ